MASLFFLAAVWYNRSKEGSVIKILSTSEKISLILSRSGHNKKWLAEQWGISQPSISQKFKDNNWKESDLRKFCQIVGCDYTIVFNLDGERIE